MPKSTLYVYLDPLSKYLKTCFFLREGCWVSAPLSLLLWLLFLLVATSKCEVEGMKNELLFLSL